MCDKEGQETDCCMFGWDAGMTTWSCDFDLDIKVSWHTTGSVVVKRQRYKSRLTLLRHPNHSVYRAECFSGSPSFIDNESELLGSVLF